jgi:DNA topoisomerase II
MPPKYQKLDQISHIHQRPDTYVGAIKPIAENNVWCYSVDENEKIKFILKDGILLSQGLLRIFIEAVSNAIDNVWRSKEAGIPCTKIMVNIDKETGETKVWNDGLGIPIEMNEENNLYNPELIFGHLLTSSNYDDKEERMTSGRNGLGIKLTNVFSSWFKVNIVDSSQTGQSYSKEWSENMRESKKEKIKKSTAKKNSTEISWIPDFAKFKMSQGYDDDTISVYKKIVCDMAMITGVAVFLNGTKIPIKTLQDYSKCFDQLTESDPSICLRSKDCEVVVTPSLSGDFEFVAFANGVENKEGGVHVDSWSEELFRPLVNKFNKGSKPSITIKDVKRFFRIFISSMVVNPEFNNQSKTRLTSPQVTTNVETKHINAIFKWDACEKIRDIIKGKELLTLKKTEKKSRGFKKIVGFDPANNAGGKKGKDCTLILCEGLSAKTYAVMGIDVGFNGKKGRDWYGIYPLRGKLLNVRNASLKSISENKEIGDVISALGLHHGVDYTDETNFCNLNYGKVMIMTDADVDGTHIKALIINLFHHLFPTLLQRDNSFVISMQTPIVKIFKRSGNLTFYTEELFHQFMEKRGEKTGESLRVKYYKGLGTSSDEEVKDTFGKKVIEYTNDCNMNRTMDKIFHTKFSNERKKWIEGYDAKASIPTPEEDAQKISQMCVSKFMDSDLIKFSLDDCGRSIPCIFDGLKQSQRKILYAAFLKNLSYSGKSMKVAQFCGFVAEKTNYHHGENCLQTTITSMAQDFIGSNNVPLFFKDGQFGSRINNGKDAANGRYIFTKLNSLTRCLFPPEDDILLDYTLDDGDKVEPEYYLPILPTVLINGCTAGIGTGWSCSIPCFNPLEISKAVKTWIHHGSLLEETEEGTVSIMDNLKPWYNQFNGVVEESGEGKYTTYGNFEQKGKNYVISELPIGVWTDKYKDFLEDLMEKKQLKTMKNYSKPSTVNFEITPKDEFTVDRSSLKLSSTLSTNNMVLFTENKKLKKFDTIDEIVEYFCQERFKLYEKRRNVCLKNMNNELLFATSKKQFIEDIISEKIILHKKTEEVIFSELKALKFPEKDGNYDYLLRMQILSFSKPKIDKLQSEIKILEAEIKKLQATTPGDLWLEDISNFEKAYALWLKIFK